jgi:ferredoxin
VGGLESAQNAAAVMGVEVGSVESPKSFNPCTGGDRAENKFIYLGVTTCQAEAAIFSGKRVCAVGCIGHGDCVRSCLFNAIAMGPDGYPVIDEEKCVGCGACARACPKELLKISTLERLLTSTGWATVWRPAARPTRPRSISAHPSDPQATTPPSTPSGSAARCCSPAPRLPAPCEINCRRGVGRPVSINQLKRFAADYE